MASDNVMPTAFVLEIPGMPSTVYDRVMELLDFNQNWPQGLISHYCARTPDGLFIFDIWERAEDWQQLANDRLGAALAEATGGEAPVLEPSFYPLHRQEHKKT